MRSRPSSRPASSSSTTGPSASGSARGAEQFRRGIRALLDAADDIATRVDDVLGLREDALLVRWTNFGTERAGGGAFERRFLMLWVFGADGLLEHMEEFDLDRDAEALARFDELATGSPPAQFANAATRSFDAYLRAWRARDWQGLVDVYAPTIRVLDRRALTGIDLQGDAFLAGLRIIFDMRDSRWESHLLATRGERLALFRLLTAVEDDEAGPSEVDSIGMVEVDAGGRCVLHMIFDPGDLDVAHEELDRRFAAGEGAPYAELLAHQKAVQQTVSARDPEVLRRLLPDDFTLLSHRRFANVGSRLARDEYVASLHPLNDLGVTGELRLDHLLGISPAATLGVFTWFGSRDGGDFEIPLAFVYGHDGRRSHSWELYDLDQLDAARARYDELSGTTAASVAEDATWPPLTSAFTRAFAARDWDTLAALLAPDLVVNDHRLLGWEPLRGPGGVHRSPQVAGPARAGHPALRRPREPVRPRVPLHDDVARHPRGRSVRGAERHRLPARRVGPDPPLRPVRPEPARRGPGPLRSAAPRPAPHPAERGHPCRRPPPGSCGGPGLGRPRAPCTRRRWCSTTVAGAFS